MKFKYFVYKLEHDKGTSYFKTCARNKATVISNISLYEGCPVRAINVKEVPLNLFTLPSIYLFNR